MKWLIFLALLQVSLGISKVRYDNYTLYQIVPQNEEQLNILKDLLENDEGLDFWNEPAGVNKFVDILVAPEQKSKLNAFFDGNRSNVKVLTDNLQHMIDIEKIAKYSEEEGMTFDAYYTLEDIYEWLDDLASTHSNVVTKIVGGKTYEGREIKGIKISHGSGRRAIFIEGGIHSREWISMATVNYITNELLNSEDPETRNAVRNYDWYIFPVTNPDGYVYSHVGARMWRKNRKPVQNEHGAAVGVDLNRNWNAHWMVAGTSDRPNNDAYGGPGPFSEIETRTMSNYIRSIADQIVMYLSFHSFTQLLLLPYGHTTEPLDNYEDVMTIGRRAMGSLAVRYNTQYVTGNIAEAIYMASGGSIDWVKYHLKVPIVLCYELRDRGQFGFMLPADQIRPTGEETMDSLLALIREGRRLDYFPDPVRTRGGNPSGSSRVRRGVGGGGRR